MRILFSLIDLYLLEIPRKLKSDRAGLYLVKHSEIFVEKPTYKTIIL